MHQLEPLIAEGEDADEVAGSPVRQSCVTIPAVEPLAAHAVACWPLHNQRPDKPARRWRRLAVPPPTWWRVVLETNESIVGAASTPPTS